MKRIVPLIAIVIGLCLLVTLFIGMQRPFAPTTSASVASADSAAEQVTATPELTDTPAPTPTPPQSQSLTVISSTLEGNPTETATLAQQTLDAIGARARATWTPTPGPSAEPREIDLTTNILLMASDNRPADPNWVPSTDVIMVLFIDAANQRAGLLSLPRDLVVAIPHHNAFRINWVYQYGLKAHGPAGGAELVKQVLHDEFGIRIDHWALIDFNGFQRIIDTLGGVDVQVPCALQDTIDNQQFVIPKGNVRMDFLTAKRYVQSRYTTSDTSRNYRQQRIMWAILKKGMELDALDKVPTLWDQVHDTVQTDMSVFDMLSLVPGVYQIDPKNHPERIHSRVLEYPAVYPFVAQDGAWLYMPDYAEISDRLDHLFDAPGLVGGKPDPAECPSLPLTSKPKETATPTPQG